MSSTREKILDLAEHYIQHDGYNGFSYHDISTSLGIRNAAVHYYFPKKEKLAREVLKKARIQFEVMVESARENDKTQLDRLHRFFRIYDNNLSRDNRVCLIGSMATDLYTLPEELNDELSTLVVNMKSWLSEVLETGRKKGEFHFTGAPGHRAGILCSCMAGALQLARILGNEEYYRIKSQLLKDITQ